MFKRIVQQKEYLFFSGIVLMAIIGYQLAFKRTIAAWQLNHKLKDQLSSSMNLSYQPDYQKRKNANLDRINERYQADTLTFRTNSINIISGIAAKHNVKLSEVPMQDQAFHSDKFIIQKLTFEGDYSLLTKMLHDLHDARNIGVIRSATYRLSKAEEKMVMIDIYMEILK